jgi:hypothetical protein
VSHPRQECCKEIKYSLSNHHPAPDTSHLDSVAASLAYQEVLLMGRLLV